ncbi:MAG: hypothetical protein GY835_09740 [bacterium]|nr:hypothetical protein [bacterium]
MKMIIWRMIHAIARVSYMDVRVWCCNRKNASLLVFLAMALPIFIASTIALMSGQRVSELKKRSLSRVGPLSLGMSQEGTLRKAGPADLECRGQGWLLDGYLIASWRCRENTSSRWIYFLEGERRHLSDEDCRPEYNDTVLGFDENERFIWYVRFSGESNFVGIEQRGGKGSQVGKAVAR